MKVRIYGEIDVPDGSSREDLKDFFSVVGIELGYGLNYIQEKEVERTIREVVPGENKRSARITMEKEQK